MREKLIDVFMHMGDHIRSLDEYGFCYDSTLAKAIEDVVEMLKQPNADDKWIPVTERLPDKDTYIIVTTDGVVTSSYWHNDRFYAFTANGIATVGCVTHWMPLPEPPKGE